MAYLSGTMTNALDHIYNLDPEPFGFVSAYRQLRPAEKVFVDAYVSDLEQSAQRTGERMYALLNQPVPPNMDQRLRAMMYKPLVRAAIAERVKELAEAAELSAAKLIKEVTAIAFSSIAHYMQIGEDGQPYFDLARATPEQLSAIKSIEIENNPRGARKFKFTLHDKGSAQGRLMQYFGLLEPDNAHAAAHMQKAGASTATGLPVGMNDDQAAELYARQING